LWDRGLTSGKIFKPQTLKEAYTPYSNEKAGIKNYGLGWRMNIYPNGKKTIYHNGWWHGNNAAFLRLLKDSVTIIVVGNKYNSNIYHAKELANLFGGYDGAGAEDEETENAKVNDNLLLLKPDSLVFKNPVLSDKEALLQQKLMDRSKRKKP
jgi:hypothetical protein